MTNGTLNPPAGRRAHPARASERSGRAPRSAGSPARIAAFGGVVVVVLALGVYLAFGDFLNRPAAGDGAISIQSSMAGFTPSEIRVTAGTTVTLDWWTQDAAMHLQGGVHTMIAPALALDETLPAESRRAVAWRVPDMPGRYDVYCDTCCGGKASPTMHGTIVIEPAA